MKNLIISHSYLYATKNNILNENKYGIRPINMSDSELIKNTITNNGYRGIHMGDLSDNNIIKDNILIDNLDYGIHLVNSSYNIIQNNTINNSDISTEYGIKITFTSINNEVKNNFIKQNDRGIECYTWGIENVFTNNLVIGNEYGIVIDSYNSRDNIISNNLFIDNLWGAYETAGANTNYFSLNGIGNYWDDHNCIDNQEPFGICDNPYIFTGNQDDFPLAEPHFPPEQVTAIINAQDTEVEISWSPPEFRDLESYNVYRFLSENSVNDTLWITIAEEITDNIFTDTEWEFLESGIYQYAVGAVYTYGFLSGTGFSNEVIKGSGVEAESNEINPLQTRLKNNYPNPFNPTTTIDFAIKEECFVEIDIYNIKGQKVKQLISKQLESGEHSLLWDGKDNDHKKVSSGIYFYNLAADGKKIETKKCIMLK